MNRSDQTCLTDARRHQVRSQQLNGLDYLEVDSSKHTIILYFLGKAPPHIKKENVLITGGRRIRDIQVTHLAYCREIDSDLDDCVHITVDKWGDFSTYRLCLVALDEDDIPTNSPFPGLDPRYTCLEFNFRPECDNGLDCKSAQICPPPERSEPEINYLAKDYASFRQLILDRLALLMPDWQEKHIPDLSITLVELLAYAGDQLSYYQDAVATEAYLYTARQRISVRRHARLVDYHLHEGCNARVWVHVQTNQDRVFEKGKISFATGYNDVLPDDQRLLSRDDLIAFPPDQYEEFQPLPLPPRPPLFQANDIKDLDGLVKRLQKSSDKTVKHLWKKLPESLQKRIKKIKEPRRPGMRLQNELIRVFNNLLRHTDLYAKAAYPDILPPTPAEHTGEAQLRYNRRLLEKTFPQTLVQTRNFADAVYLFEALNEIKFYTWGDESCCLPRGATQVTLQDEWEKVTTTGDVSQKGKQTKTRGRRKKVQIRLRKLRHLQPGDVLVFKEVLGPKTGKVADADPSRRHAVRLTEVKLSVDPLNNQPIVEIRWDDADALPFPFCISAIMPPPACNHQTDISVALGNILLADHGRWADPPIKEEDVSEWYVKLHKTSRECLGKERATDPEYLSARFLPPPLRKTPLTFCQSLPVYAPASELMTQDPRLCVPDILLTGEYKQAFVSHSGEQETNQETAVSDSIQTNAHTKSYSDERIVTHWQAKRDLLSSRPLDHHFVVELDNRRRAHLRFGDGDLGRQPAAGTKFTVQYRIGNGPMGNVGAEAVTHVITENKEDGLLLNPCNPLPAQGGIAFESTEDARLFAPHSFKHELERAIIPEDYAAIVMRDFKYDVQRAAATLRWMGSWYEVLVVIDPKTAVSPSQILLEKIHDHLQRYRRIGHDLIVKAARYVPVDIEMCVYVKSDYLRGHVKGALLDLFSNRRLPHGGLGFFHPDNLTFGEGLHLSKLVSTAQSEAGVESVVINKMERLYEGPNNEIEEGILRLGPLEVVRLDNDPSFPENGRFTLKMEGGR